MYFIRRLFSWRITSPVLSGLCRSFLWMLLGAFVLSLLLWGSGLKEQDLTTYTYIVHGIAAAFGGLTAGRRATSKGWYQGSLTGDFTESLCCWSDFWRLTVPLQALMLCGLWLLRQSERSAECLELIYKKTKLLESIKFETILLKICYTGFI